MAYAKTVDDVVHISSSKLLGFDLVSNLPFDRVFRSAWKLVNGDVVEDLEESKLISHKLRRTKREELYAPHDEIISKQIPGQSAIDAEAAREVIRNRDSELQELIDSKLKLNTLKEVLFENDLISEDQLGERSFENGY